MAVKVELGGCDPKRICVDFKYEERLVYAIRDVDGRSYVKTPHKHWHVPLDMNTCRQLRKAFGNELEIGPLLRSWAINASREETSLGTLALADTAELQRLPEVLPLLAMCIHVGPVGITFTDDAQWLKALDGPGSFQVADVRFMVEAQAPLNANQQGLGKTPEWIAAVWEGGWERGNHLVVAPAAAVDGTWEEELEKWQADAKEDVGIFCCTGTAAQRKATLKAWQRSKAPVKWVVVNPEMVRLRKDTSRTSKTFFTISPTLKAARTACRCDISDQPHEHYVQAYPELDIVWDTYCIDECHRNSIRNHKSITSKSLRGVPYRHKRTALSGTPMKRKGADVWGILNWLRPDVFTSYWRFAKGYFRVEENDAGHPVVLELLPERQDAFFTTLKPYVLRRTKAECVSWLPPKQFVDVWCRMGPAQAKAYTAMLKDGVARLGDDEISVTSILAEFTRLGQFANAVCKVRNGKVVPTAESCKLDALLEKMDEAGMFDEDSTEKQIVFSSSRELIELTAQVLADQGLKVDIVSGKRNKRGERRQIKEAFQTGDTRVLCVVTQAGGVSLTLDAADTAHFLDEPWAPDEAEQAEDRLHRVSRQHQVTIYVYRSRDTIDEYRMSTAADKKEAQAFILDVRRQLLREAS
jgi:SNF2 family DNA or RNA helicase